MPKHRIQGKGRLWERWEEEDEQRDEADLLSTSEGKSHRAEASTHRRTNSSKRNRKSEEYNPPTPHRTSYYTEMEDPPPEPKPPRRKVPIVIEDTDTYRVHPRKATAPTNPTSIKRKKLPEINVYYPMPSQPSQTTPKKSSRSRQKPQSFESCSNSRSSASVSIYSDDLESNEPSVAQDGSYSLESLQTDTSGSYTEGGEGSYLGGSSAQTNTTTSYNDEEQRQERNTHSRHRDRLPILSKSLSTMESLTTVADNDVGEDPGGFFSFVASDLSGVLSTKQDVAYCSLLFVSLQLLVFMLQLTMCGIAPFDTNMMIGPFPDAFSFWGGKNPYLLLEENEWWRFVTPAVLNVGVFSLVINAICIFSACALFEREWGSSVWLFFLFVGTIGCSSFSNYVDPDTIAVGSSGSLLGIYGAKISETTVQVLAYSNKHDDREVMSLHQFSVLFGGLISLFILGCFTYIDLSGNLGGLLCGLSAGALYFSYEFRGLCSRLLVSMAGFCALLLPPGAAIYYFIEENEPNEQLADVCQYFRNLFTEGYECGCMW